MAIKKKAEPHLSVGVLRVIIYWMNGGGDAHTDHVASGYFIELAHQQIDKIVDEKGGAVDLREAARLFLESYPHALPDLRNDPLACRLGFQNYQLELEADPPIVEKQENTFVKKNAIEQIIEKLGDLGKKRALAIHAAIENQSLLMQYSDKSGTITERKITPLFMTASDSHLHVFAFCHEKNDTRLFCVERIKAVDPIPRVRTFTAHEIAQILFRSEHAARIRHYMQKAKQVLEALQVPVVVPTITVSFECGPTFTAHQIEEATKSIVGQSISIRPVDLDPPRMSWNTRMIGNPPQPGSVMEEALRRGIGKVTV